MAVMIQKPVQIDYREIADAMAQDAELAVAILAEVALVVRPQTLKAAMIELTDAELVHLSVFARQIVGMVAGMLADDEDAA